LEDCLRIGSNSFLRGFMFTGHRKPWRVGDWSGAIAKDLMDAVQPILANRAQLKLPDGDGADSRDDPEPSTPA